MIRTRRPRTAWPRTAICLLAWAGAAQAAPDIEAVGDSLTPAQTEATQQLLAEAVDLLPAAWADALVRRIEVEWRDDLPAHVHGRAQARRLLLDRNLLDGWMARPPGAGPEDAATHAALAAVIHELAHFYDRTPQGGLSRDPRLLDLAGWQVSPMRLGLRISKNAFSDRSPDRYELNSPVEFVAVNLEYFLLDPAYACRRPALYAYFAAHFGAAPPHTACAPDFVYLQAGADTDPSPLLALDPARVYAVDYLLAEGNERAMSRWGHSMLRLIVCAPGRPPGPDCRLDLAYHQVLSFRAFVGHVQVSSWRGLTGSYPSRLFLLPLAQVIDDYTKVELRGLQSIPLRLDRDEIAALLERTARLHWSYDGRYYFLSNNCAVETYKLLHDGVPRLAGDHLSSITPTGLLRRLERAGVADGSVLADHDEALRQGYRFDALSARYQAMFDVAREELRLPQATAQDWLNLPAGERAPWLEQADLRASAALLLLEEAALRRQEVIACEDLKRHFFGRGARGTEALAAARDVLQLEGFLSRPAALLPGPGYGLPQAEERETLAQEGDRQAAEWRAQRDALLGEAREWLPAQRQAALDATQVNVDTLGRRLRHLHEEQGGFRLPKTNSQGG